ncbi:MAG: DUF4446 family protein [Fimbriimonadales bacterium]
MKGLLESLSQHAPALILILSSAVLALIVMVAVLLRRVTMLQNRWRGLLDGVRGDNLERMLNDHLRERLATDERLDGHDGRLARLEDKMQTAKRHLGLVRFDAFDDVGGSQSFALALYDDNGDGAVLTSLLGRAECRVYGKAMARGRTERNLSQEELRAIEEAQAVAPRPIVS